MRHHFYQQDCSLISYPILRDLAVYSGADGRLTRAFDWAMLASGLVSARRARERPRGSVSGSETSCWATRVTSAISAGKPRANCRPAWKWSPSPQAARGRLGSDAEAWTETGGQLGKAQGSSLQIQCYNAST